MPKKKKAVFTADQTEVIRELVRKEFCILMLDTIKKDMASPKTPAPVPENNLIIISKSFQGANAEQMELDINDWLKTTGAQEIHKIDSIKDPLSSMGVIKTVFVKVKAVPTTTLGATPDAASSPKGN